ncbi:MAG: polyprenyl synthetase family protein [Deltaproteobacteria bacterium]|nr:polyprenyl synthetase family protein [Deltaproteobacteria bacterium]
MFKFKEYLTEKQELVNNSLRNILEHFSVHSRLMKAVEFSLMAGGKRVRPVLCIAACEAVHGDIQDTLPVACALEMIHTYSLIHDDLPAMDDDDLRRGKPTCHIRFDEATAILAGDALLTLAFQVLSSANILPGYNDKNHHPSVRLKIINILSSASGWNGMIGGQMLDISSEKSVLNLDKLEHMHSLKTGALIEASVSAGAIIGGCNTKQLKHLSLYAKKTGLAFQVADDILNVEGDPLVMGKAAGTDAHRNKSTYPSLMGLNGSKKFAGQLIYDALQALDIFDKSSDPLRKIASYIINRKK